jgi:agmatine deiminase
VPRQVAALLGLRAVPPGIVMEGGSLDVNGQGTLLTTESCLLNPNRNPTLDRAAIERISASYLGVRHVSLARATASPGDDTDGQSTTSPHRGADTSASTVRWDDPRRREPTSAPEKPERSARASRTEAAHGSGTLPNAGPVVRDGQRLPASYCRTFYVGKRGRARCRPFAIRATRRRPREVLGAMLFPGPAASSASTVAISVLGTRGPFHLRDPQHTGLP